MNGSRYVGKRSLQPRRAPSPLEGEGWGGGYSKAGPFQKDHPPPCPSPARGEGTPPESFAENATRRSWIEGIAIAGTSLVADVAGALYWPEEAMLVVSDLHLEKGSSFAARGSLLPPYDTADALSRLARLIAHYAPRTVVALGDNFHDGGGAGRIAASDRESLTALQRGREWIWIVGNHDPEPLDGIGGAFAETLCVGPLTFRHAAAREDIAGEISGHLHPVAVVAVRGRGLRRRCFATDGRRMVMPAFGAYAGGLNVRHRAFAEIFAAMFTAHVMGDERTYAIFSTRCLPDWSC